ncbi:MAG: hypothetical protein Q9227_004754 [Pyrenula ochraceoflavens]
MPEKNFVYNGFNYSFAEYSESGNDNMLAKGQSLSVPRGRYFSVQMLAAGETGLAAGFVNATYSDGSTSSTQVLVPAWWSWPYPAGGDLIFPNYYTNQTTDYNRSNIYQTINWLDSTKELVSLTLPNVTAGSDSGPGGTAITTRLHIFSASLMPAENATIQTNGPAIEVQYARSTQKWMEGTDKTQVIEVLVNNAGSSDWVLSPDAVTARVISDGFETVTPAVIKRLKPGDQAMVEIGVVNKAGVRRGTSGNATVVLSASNVSVSFTFNATYGIADYQPTYESIYTHETPSWYNNAKFGIFIHWGVYSVPGWGNSGKNESYAEWYWWDLNKGPSDSSQTYQYHERTYGPEVVYDDFIQNFTAATFDPAAWVNLFAASGAQYFVQVSKHHDGYAIFDLPSKVTNRTSVALPPHRNLLQEIFSAAEHYQPHLHRATYYSLPEWFHPDYRPLGFGQWPGGNATNPFTNATLPYTGYVPLSNYITDKILPEMQTLADMGTEILWCDIGGPNLTADFAASWFNTAAAQNRQVVLDARCGLPGDFDTPEYARYGAVQRRKWESNLGMDPFSYGYNRATPASAYLNASSIVTSLVDIISKNGNLLLDIGPRADGSIVEVEERNLREAGEWIHNHAEAIFNTTYWFVMPGVGDTVRFTQTGDAFYIHLLERPRGTVRVEAPVPWREGDEVTVIGGKRSGDVVPCRAVGGGIEMDVSEEVVEGDKWVWVFKIPFERNGNLTSAGGPTQTSAARRSAMDVWGWGAGPLVFALSFMGVFGWM